MTNNLLLPLLKTRGLARVCVQMLYVNCGMPYVWWRCDEATPIGVHCTQIILNERLNIEYKLITCRVKPTNLYLSTDILSLSLSVRLCVCVFLLSAQNSMRMSIGQVSHTYLTLECMQHFSFSKLFID